jgi:hypothetical protein
VNLITAFDEMAQPADGNGGAAVGHIKQAHGAHYTARTAQTDFRIL